MSKPIWPYGDILLEGYGREAAENRRFSQMERGAPKIRVSSRAGLETIRAAVWMRRFEVASFERWHRDVLKDGGLPFLIRDQRRDGYPLLRHDGTPLLNFNGKPLISTAWWLVYLGEGNWRETQVTDDGCRIEMTLMRMPR
jgi:hypothetical protein